MASVFPVERTLDRQGTPRAQTPDHAPDAYLAPIMAGAFARGVAETFTLLGVPAFFLDREGLVLFVTEAAKTQANSRLKVQSGHLLAGTRADNRVLAKFIERALRDAGSRPAATLKAAGLTLQALPTPGREPDANQLLHAIVVLGEAPAPTEPAPA